MARIPCASRPGTWRPGWLVDGAVDQRGRGAGGGERSPGRGCEALRGGHVVAALEREDVAARARSAGRGPAPSPAFGNCGRWACRSTIPGSTTHGRRSSAVDAAPRRRPANGPAPAIPIRRRRRRAVHRPRGGPTDVERPQPPRLDRERRGEWQVDGRGQPVGVDHLIGRGRPRRHPIGQARDTEPPGSGRSGSGGRRRAPTSASSRGPRTGGPSIRCRHGRWWPTCRASHRCR